MHHATRCTDLHASLSGRVFRCDLDYDNVLSVSLFSHVDLYQRVLSEPQGSGPPVEQLFFDVTLGIYHQQVWLPGGSKAFVFDSPDLNLDLTDLDMDGLGIVDGGAPLVPTRTVVTLGCRETESVLCRGSSGGACGRDACFYVDIGVPQACPSECRGAAGPHLVGACSQCGGATAQDDCWRGRGSCSARSPPAQLTHCDCPLTIPPGAL